VFFFIRYCPSELLSSALKLGSQLLFDFPHPVDVERWMRVVHSLIPARWLPRSLATFSNDPNGYLVTSGLYAYFNPKTRENAFAGEL